MTKLTRYKPEYYYLNGEYNRRRKYKGVRKVTLLRDLKRGVKFLNESSYHTNYGATRSSMQFLRFLMITIDVTKAYRAKMTYGKRQHFTLRVWTTTGYLLMFKGVSSGYIGEGTRGCHDVLKACGFNQKQCNIPFKHGVEEFEVRKGRRQ